MWVTSDDAPPAHCVFVFLPALCSMIKAQEGCLMANLPSATFKGEPFSEIHSYLYKLKQQQKKWICVKQPDWSCKHTSSWIWEKHSVRENVTLWIQITPPSKPQTHISRWVLTTMWSVWLWLTVSCTSLIITALVYGFYFLKYRHVWGRGGVCLTSPSFL